MSAEGENNRVIQFDLRMGAQEVMFWCTHSAET